MDNSRREWPVWCSGNIVFDWLTLRLAGALLDSWCGLYGCLIIENWQKDLPQSIVRGFVSGGVEIATALWAGVFPVGRTDIMMDQLQLDLSIVKKESQYFEDYGHNGGNLLDNIIPDPDFHHFGQGANVVSKTLLFGCWFLWSEMSYYKESHLLNLYWYLLIYLSRELLRFALLLRRHRKVSQFQSLFLIVFCSL